MDTGLQKCIIKQGLLSRPRYIPQWFRYDKYGSIYNDECLYNPYYYFHRAEVDLLQNQKEIKDIVSDFGMLVDMGSGNSEKTKFIFDYILRKERKVSYYPIDISEENDLLMVSADITTDKETIEKCYLNPLGVGEKLYTNSICRLNRDYGANINTSDFKVECDFTKDDSPDTVSPLKVWVRAQKKMSFAVPALDLTLNLEDNEIIFLHEGEGMSCKYSFEQLSNLGRKAGLFIKALYTNKHAALILFCNDEDNLPKK